MSAGLTGAQIRSLRVERGLTQAQVAGLLGVDPSLVCQVEKRGIKHPQVAKRWESTITREDLAPPSLLKGRIDGRCLQARRVLLGLTQAQVGARLGGLTQESVANAERRGIARASSARRWAQALEVTLEELCASTPTQDLDLLRRRAQALKRELDEVTAQIAALVGEVKP